MIGEIMSFSLTSVRSELRKMSIASQSFVSFVKDIRNLNSSSAIMLVERIFHQIRKVK